MTCSYFFKRQTSRIVPCTRLQSRAKADIYIEQHTQGRAFRFQTWTAFILLIDLYYY